MDAKFQRIYYYPAIACVGSVLALGLSRFLSMPSILQNPLQSYESKMVFRAQLKRFVRPPFIAFATFVGLSLGIVEYEVCRFKMF